MQVKHWSDVRPFNVLPLTFRDAHHWHPIFCRTCGQLMGRTAACATCHRFRDQHPNAATMEQRYRELVTAMFLKLRTLPLPPKSPGQLDDILSTFFKENPDARAD